MPNLPWIAWVAYGSSLVAAVLALLVSRCRPRSTTMLFVGLSLFVAFTLSTLELKVGLEGGANTLIQYTWAVATVTLLGWGIYRRARDAAWNTILLLAVGFLASLSTERPDLFAHVMAVVLLVRMLWESAWHRTPLEWGLWSFYVLPLPAYVAGRLDPDVFYVTFLFRQWCQCCGALILAGWTLGRFRSLVSGLPVPASSSPWAASPSSCSPGVSTGSSRSTPDSARRTPHYLGSS